VSVQGNPGRNDQPGSTDSFGTGRAASLVRSTRPYTVNVTLAGGVPSQSNVGGRDHWLGVTRITWRPEGSGGIALIAAGCSGPPNSTRDPENSQARNETAAPEKLAPKN
jgi:hypothetical protein